MPTPKRGRPRGPDTTHTAFRLRPVDLDRLDRIARELQRREQPASRTHAIRWAAEELNKRLEGEHER
jgi:hypothetical protein